MKTAPLILGLALALSGCASAPVAPLSSTADVGTISPAEKRLWTEAMEFDDAMARSDRLYDDPAATQYVQSVMDRLYPELRGTVRVRIVKSPHLNAFALPNGSIYIHLGLLARLENEAQLATVLGHEAAHFTHKHGLRQRETVKSASAFATVTSVIGIPLIDVLATSSIYGYSRDLEREADQIGFERLVKAGYAPSESVKSFELLAAESKALDLKDPFFFSTHPRMQERIETYQELVAKQPATGRTGRIEFLAATRGVRLANLETDLSMDRYKSIILALEDHSRLAEYPPEASYYLGEALRKRGAQGDESQAEKAYRDAIGKAPSFAPSYRALGMLYMKRRDGTRAQNLLGKYLQLAPNAPDRDYVLQYYAELKREGKR